jgi:hypothetical protein
MIKQRRFIKEVKQQKYAIVEKSSIKYARMDISTIQDAIPPESVLYYGIC